MPIATQDIEAEEFLRHNNVCVYRTYDNDDIDNGVNPYWFTLDPYGREGDDMTRFDVRSLDVPAAAKLKEHPPCITPSTPVDDPVRLQWVRWDESVEPAIIKEMIIEAIEAGLVRFERHADDDELDGGNWNPEFSQVEIALQNAEVRWSREALLDVIQEAHDDILAAHGKDDGEGTVLDEESLDWPDLAVSHKKMAAVLKDCRAGEVGGGNPMPASPAQAPSASSPDPSDTTGLLHEMLDAILQGLDRKASATAFMADVDQLGKAFIAKLQPAAGN